MKSKVLQKEIVDEGRVRITNLQEKLPIKYKTALANPPTLHGWPKVENCPHHSGELNNLARQWFLSFVIQGQATAKEFYKRHHRWTEGLISAAKAVGWGAKVLV